MLLILSDARYLRIHQHSLGRNLQFLPKKSPPLILTEAFLGHWKSLVLFVKFIFFCRHVLDFAIVENRAFLTLITLLD